MTPSRHAAEWLHALGPLPAPVAADARLRLLDTLAVAAAAAPLPIGQAVRRGAAALGQGTQAGLIGGGRSTPALAALVNGALAHALDFDDTHAASVMHPSAPAIATALAMAEATGATGDRLLTGIAAGIELNCRLGLVAPGAFHGVGQHPTGALGTLSAAMIAAWFLGLTPDGIVAAAGIAASQSSGVLEAYADGTWSKTLHPGWAAHAGIAAAHLAAAGFTGPETALDGRYGVFRAHLPAATPLDFAALTDGLGTRWHMLDTAFKLYPNAHAIHAFIECALALAVEPTQIVHIEAEIPSWFAGQIAEPRAAKIAPRTTTHARASLFYALACACIDGAVAMAHYQDDAIRRPDLLAFAARIHHRVTDVPGPIRFCGALTLHTTDGRTLRHAIDHANGTGPRGLGRAAVERKARLVAPGPEIERIIAALDHIDDPAAIIPQ